MAAKRNRLSVRLVVIAAVAILVIAIITFMSCQEQWGSDGIFFGFYGGGTTREPATETQVQVAIGHTCVFNDELVLETVEIYGESETPVKSWAVNMTLNSVSGKLILLDALHIGLWTIGLLIPSTSERISEEAAKLAEEIRAESFATGYFTIDLRQIKQPLPYGEIPITAKATLIHNGERLTLEREVIVKYGGPLT